MNNQYEPIRELLARVRTRWRWLRVFRAIVRAALVATAVLTVSDRKSTRLNSSHSQISYAVFCLKKKNKHLADHPDLNPQLACLNNPTRPHTAHEFADGDHSATSHQQGHKRTTQPTSPLSPMACG